MQVLLYQLFKDFVVRKFALHLYSRHVAVSVSRAGLTRDCIPGPTTPLQRAGYRVPSRLRAVT